MLYYSIHAAYRARGELVFIKPRPCIHFDLQLHPRTDISAVSLHATSHNRGTHMCSDTILLRDPITMRVIRISRTLARCLDTSRRADADLILFSIVPRSERSHRNGIFIRYRYRYTDSCRITRFLPCAGTDQPDKICRLQYHRRERCIGDCTRLKPVRAAKARVVTSRL